MREVHHIFCMKCVIPVTSDILGSNLRPFTVKPTLLLFLLPLSAIAQPDTPNPGLKYYYPVAPANPPQEIHADVCVYGGTPGGVAAAVQAARMGKKAVLVVFRRHVGGMTSGGLTATDIGNPDSIGGLAKEFYQRIGKKKDFKPSQAEAVFLALLKEAGVTVYYEHRLKEVAKSGNLIASISFENGNSVKAKMFIDATYEGDLLAKAGVSFHVGREGNAAYGETINGIQFNPSHNFSVKVDPYVVPGDPGSGLLPTVSSEATGKKGDGDKRVQAYTFRFNLSNAPDRIPFPKPDRYDPNRYAVYQRYVAASGENLPVPFKLANGDCNTKGGFSTNNLGANYQWPDGDYETREKIFQDHVNHQKGLAWFASHDPGIPGTLREKVSSFGLMAGEFLETGGWPHELYVREGRRMVSDHVITQHDCLSKRTAGDSIGLASYTMDSHHCRRIVIDGAIRNEGDVQVKVPKPYPVSYRSITPKESECGNLLVSVCLSASHIAYGSIRMEPVFMILGQSAGTAASLAIDGNVPVQEIPYGELSERLLSQGQILVWKQDPGKIE